MKNHAFMNYEPKINEEVDYLSSLLKKYWFAPQDVLLRSVEANIWESCKFKHPILDIGIGDGEISKYIFDKNLLLDVGIDIGERDLVKAKRTNKYKEVLCVNAEKMPFKNNKFATVIGSSTFEHICNDVQAVSEVSRVLKNGGYFFFTVPSDYLPKIILRLEKVKNAKKKLELFNNRANHIHYHSIQEWKKLLNKNKLEVVFYQYYFPESTVSTWYKLFKFSITKIRNKELWSYLGHSYINRFIPNKLAVIFWRNYLKKAYENAFLTDENGGMLFVVAQKML